MKNYFSKKSTGDRNNSRSGRKSFGSDKGRGFGQSAGNSDRVIMHSAVCNECNTDCQVPFKPNGRKPVLCNNCFRSEEGSAPRRGGDRSDRSERSETFDKPYRSTPRDCGNSDVVKQLKALNSKMDKLIELLSEFEDEDSETEDELELDEDNGVENNASDQNEE